MSQPFWTLDKSKAAKVGQSNYITGNSYDIFKILSAAWKSNIKDNAPTTYYMSLHIMNADKATTHIDIYWGNEDGERWSGEAIINALMLCANIPALSQVQGQYKQYDFDQKKDVTVNGLVAPELANKKVGMFLSDNYYFNSNQGEVKRGGLNLFNVYDAETRQLPHEKANNQPANPDNFDTVIEAMQKSSQKSLEDAQKKAGLIQPISGQPINQMTQPMQGNNTTYQRNPAPTNQQPVAQNFNNNVSVPAPQNAMNGSAPIDDDIPFAPYFDGVM